VVGITGASGSIYGFRLIEKLANGEVRIGVVATRAGMRVSDEELGEGRLGELKKFPNVSFWENDDFEAPFMSGSNAPEAVIVAPCSMGTLSAIAHGSSGNLLERVADVALKERKRLILMVRETPLNLIHLENMVKAARAGAEMLPAMPAFYHRPASIDDMVNFVVGKTLSLLGVEHRLFKEWKGRTD
jgi:flavin prenyltransferase